MDAAAFRALVYRALGARLEHATPANVAELAAWLQDQAAPRDAEGTYVIAGDPAETPESAVKRFLVEALEADAEPARQRLWLTLLELWFAMVETDAAERFDRLFADLDE